MVEPMGDRSIELLRPPEKLCPPFHADRPYRRGATQMTRKAIAAVLLVALAGSCSSDDPETATATTAGQTEANDVAYEYALDLAGGVTTGCSQASPGPEAEAHPGCIFSVAFAGCLEGLTGEQVGPLPVEEEFPDEPALVDLHRQAVADCSS